MSEETKINMKFEDKKEKTETNPDEKKGNLFTKAWHTVTAPARWVGEQIKKSPAGAVISAVGGIAVGYGVKALLGRNKTESPIYGELQDGGENMLIESGEAMFEDEDD